MRITGSVVSAQGGSPVEGARLALSIGKRELAVLYSDAEGRVVHGESEDYIGKTLQCKVEKEGFAEKVFSQAIEDETVQLRIELVPETQRSPSKQGKTKDKAQSAGTTQTEIEIHVHVKDEKGRPLRRATVTCNMSGFEAGSCVSDDHGHARVVLTRPDK